MTTDDGSYGAYKQQQAQANKPPPRVSGAGRDVRDTFSAFNPPERIPQERPSRGPKWTILSRERVGGGTKVRWRLVYYDLSGGFAQDVDLSDGEGANIGGGTLDVRSRRRAVQQLAHGTLVPPATPHQQMITWSHWNNRLVLMGGHSPNDWHYVETSTTDPTPVPFTYTVVANEAWVSWHGPLTFGDKNYFVVANMATQPRVFTEPGSAVVGTMDVSLSGCMGWMDMPVNIRPGAPLKLFVTVSGSIFAMTSAMAYNTPPNLVGSASDLYKLPWFTHPLGCLTWGRGLRAFWKAPERSPVGFSGIYDAALHSHPRELAASSSQRRIRLHHCDVTGLDWDEQKIDELPFITNAEKWRNGLVVTNDRDLIWKAGNGKFQRIYLNEQMPYLTNRERRIVDFGDRGRDLIIRIDEVAINGSTGATTTYDVALNGDTWTLSPASPVVTLANTGPRSLAGVGGGIPIGESTNFAHGMAEGVMYQRPIPRPGQSGWDLRGRNLFWSPTTFTLPDTVLPEPFCYLTNIGDGARFGGYLPAGHRFEFDWGKSHEDGTTAATGVISKWDGPLNRASKYYPHQSNQGVFQSLLAATGTITNVSGSGLETAQVLPLILEGHTFVPDDMYFEDGPMIL